MKSNTDAALAYVFKDEGGYAERPEEGGGAVNRGVTFTVFSAWRKTKGYPEPTWADLKAMTVEEATEIYKAQYLYGVHFDELPAGVDYAVLDASITGGISGSIKLLQEVLGLKPVDGQYGLVTRWAATHRPVAGLINKLCDARLAKYKTFKIYNKIANPTAIPEKQKTWGQIWATRIEVVRKRATGMMLTVVTEPPPVLTPVPMPVKSNAFPPAILKMPASTELSKQMVKRGGTPAQFLNYLRDEVAPKMAAWRPRGVVLHNTGTMKWPGVVNGKDILPEQRLDNMTVDWRNRKFPSGPHLVIAPDGMIWCAWPLWRAGTHSPSWNNTHWGIETVGDWNKEKPTEAMIRATAIASAGLLAMLGHPVSSETVKFHKDDPGTSHKACPGPNFGTKASWLKSVTEELHAMNAMA